MPGRFLPTASLTPLRIVFTLYAASILLEMVEHWTDPAATVVLVGLAALALHTFSRAAMLLFLGAATVYFLAFRFPEVANHVNLILFVNIALIGALAHSFCVDPAFDEDTLWLRIAPLLRLSIVATFAVAGFHKLNADFLDPAVSCITDFTYQVWLALRTDFAGTGAPTYAMVGLVGAGAVAAFARQRARDFRWPPIDWKAVLTPVAAIAVLGVVLVAINGAGHLATPKDIGIFAIALFVLCWQLVEAPLLLFRRFQWMALLVSLVVHAQLAMIRIVDFQAVALALLAAFVPAQMWAAWRDEATLRIGRLALNRLQLYLLLNVVAGGAVMAQHHFSSAPIPDAFVVTGVLFNTAVLIMIWPFLTGLFSRARTWRWEGVDVLSAKTPRWLYVVPVLIVPFGLTSHFGLRTTGNFSMFSNLRTEGDLSNHLVLRGNPLKAFGYQDDLVHFVRIDDAAAEIGHHYEPLQGMSLPMVEFRKLLLLWREDGRRIDLTIRYRGETRTYEDVANDPAWRVGGWSWAMRLLDFRAVQSERPNRCRW